MSGDNAFLPIVLTVPETARVLRIGRNQAYDAVRRGDLPSIRVGRRILIPRHAIDQLLNGSSIPSRTQAVSVDDHAS